MEQNAFLIPGLKHCIKQKIVHDKNPTLSE